jgi:hypothetical protein
MFSDLSLFKNEDKIEIRQVVTTVFLKHHEAAVGRDLQLGGGEK